MKRHLSLVGGLGIARLLQDIERIEALEPQAESARKTREAIMEALRAHQRKNHSKVRGAGGAH